MLNQCVLCTVGVSSAVCLLLVCDTVCGEVFVLDMASITCWAWHITNTHACWLCVTDHDPNSVGCEFGQIEVLHAPSVHCQHGIMLWCFLCTRGRLWCGVGCSALGLLTSSVEASFLLLSLLLVGRVSSCSFTAKGVPGCGTHAGVAPGQMSVTPDVKLRTRCPVFGMCMDFAASRRAACCDGTGVPCMGYSRLCAVTWPDECDS